MLTNIIKHEAVVRNVDFSHSFSCFTEFTVIITYFTLWSRMSDLTVK